MSTRCNVILKDGNDSLIFYRHSDGYPEGVTLTLTKFVKMLNSSIRSNVGQGGGWLLALGMIEYQTVDPKYFTQSGVESWAQDGDKIIEAIESFEPSGWKLGAYEPTTCIHGDIDHLYMIDMNCKTLVELTLPKYPHTDSDDREGWSQLNDIYFEALQNWQGMKVKTVMFQGEFKKSPYAL